MPIRTIVLSLFLFAASLVAQQRHPVLMISIDGLRPDYVTHADEHQLKIPTLRRFLTEGTYADGVMGVFPTVTYPSHTTLVTGVWPAEHGMIPPTPQRAKRFTRCSPGSRPIPTMALKPSSIRSRLPLSAVSRRPPSLSP